MQERLERFIESHVTDEDSARDFFANFGTEFYEYECVEFVGRLMNRTIFSAVALLPTDNQEVRRYWFARRNASDVSRALYRRISKHFGFTDDNPFAADKSAANDNKKEM